MVGWFLITFYLLLRGETRGRRRDGGAVRALLVLANLFPQTLSFPVWPNFFLGKDGRKGLDRWPFFIASLLLLCSPK